MKFDWDWDKHWAILVQATGETLFMASFALLFGGIFGLLFGVLLYATRPNGLYHNRLLFGVLNFLVNLVRPIPFLILLFVVSPITYLLVQTTISPIAMIPPMSIAAAFGFSRIVEQNLVTVPSGVIEAARATGASRARILFGLVVPEALAPLILGFTFLFVAIVDMSAVAGYIAAGGLGDFALQYGYKRWNYGVILVAVTVIVIIVQGVQALGNWLANRILRR